MNLNKLKEGSEILHPRYGAGTVVFVGEEYLGLKFEDGEQLISRLSLEEEMDEECPEDVTRPPWPQDTFLQDPENIKHYLGAHWDPFVDETHEILDRMPEMLPQCVVVDGSYNKDKKLPETWPEGAHMAWPDKDIGLMFSLKLDDEAMNVESVFPFMANGRQLEMTLDTVYVWRSGVEAQIFADWGEAKVYFFDTHYLANRCIYEYGKQYKIALAGLAYSAKPAQIHEFESTRHPDVAAWMNRNLKEGEKPHGTTFKVRIDDAALLFSLDDRGGDVDEYGFRGPVRDVEEFKDFLGQEGGRVRVTVMRLEAGDADLDIWITKRAWSGDAPPEVGGKISGNLWLQGHAVV